MLCRRTVLPQLPWLLNKTLAPQGLGENAVRNIKWVVVSALAGIAVFGFQAQRSCAQEGVAEGTRNMVSSHSALYSAVLQDGLRYWDKGFLINYESNHTFETTPSRSGVILYDRDGRVARQPIIWIDGASTVSVNHAAVDHSGNIVVAGAAVDSRGALASFIGLIGSDDRLQKIIRTTPFVSDYVCLLDDGTVWSYGTERDDHHNVLQNSPRLRHYSFEKGQLGALLNVTTLPDYASSSEQWRFSRGMPFEVNLRCNSKMVVLYSGRTGDLFELDLKTNTTTITKVPLFPASCPTFCISGFGLTDAGEIFASFIDRRKSSMPLSGLFRLTHIQPGKAEWVALPGTLGIYLKQSPMHALWGTDGNNLVYSQQHDGRLYWSKPN